jgi:uncharacterized membrane protein
METLLLEWVSLLLRWLHMIAGMAWIGASFYFMHIDASMKPVADIPKGGETWEVHGGGFYQVRKWLVAPDKLPPDLIWHKWEAYTTWVTGFFLLMTIYYLGADLYLIDPAVRQMSPLVAGAIGCGALAAGWVVYDLLCRSSLAKNEVALGAVLFVLVVAMAWGFSQVFSGRGAMLHTGAVLATIMSANVLLVIIPNQAKVIEDLKAGRAPDPALGYTGKVRSTHNNYITLPVVFMMISGHYPMTFSTTYIWAIVALVLIAGAFIRWFYNMRHSGRGSPWWAWGVAAAAILATIWITIISTPAARERLGWTPLREPAVKVAAADKVPGAVDDILTSRCSMCHAKQPVWSGIVHPPKGISLETAAEMVRYKAAINIHSVLTTSMPPNNITAMTAEERRVLAEWIAGRS